MTNPVEFIIDLLKRGLESLGKYYGVYAGQVVDNQDEEKRGRIKVLCPTLSNAPLAEWAEPSFPLVPGKDYGGYFRPEINDWVWVVFVHGNLDKPVYLGGWWASGDLSSEFEQAVPGVIGWKTKYGHKLLFNEKDKKIHAETKDGHTLVLDDKEQKIEAKTKGGITITLDDKNKKVVIDSTYDQIVMKSDGIHIGSEGARQPLVLGFQFLSYIAKHTHLQTSGAPTSPPTEPPTKMLLSDRCFTEKS